MLPGRKFKSNIVFLYQCWKEVSTLLDHVESKVHKDTDFLQAYRIAGVYYTELLGSFFNKGDYSHECNIVRGKSLLNDVSTSTY